MCRRDDWAPGGLLPGDAVEVARMLKAAGPISSTCRRAVQHPEGRPQYGRLYHVTPFAEEIRLGVGIATMAVGTHFVVFRRKQRHRSGTCGPGAAALGRTCLIQYWTRHAAADQGYQMKWPWIRTLTVANYRPRFK